MVDQSDNEIKAPDPVEFSRVWIDIASKSQKIISEFVRRQQAKSHKEQFADPLNVSHAFIEFTRQIMSDPTKFAQNQLALWQDYMALWQNTADKIAGKNIKPVILPSQNDFRFRDNDWHENTIFDFIKQSYLLTARWMQNTVKNTDGIDEKTMQKLDFYTRQFADAMAPTNFVMTNPKVLRETIERGGQNLVQGLDNLIEDLENSEDQLRIKMVEEDAFEVGKDIATSPGKIVYQNDLLQLIQYNPTTPTVSKTPLLIMPPWINKYYILDLQEENSFVKWAIDQGITIFMVSWVNPDEKLSEKTFEDYIIEGPLACLEAIQKATGEGAVNVIGYCLGGTLLAATLAVLERKHKKSTPSVKSATFFTTMVDFEQAGELGIFIDEEQLAQLETKMNNQGYLKGREMAATFNMLRAKDLIWSFVINNYLMGRDPFPFDLLFWNSDSTRMPAAMHSFYLRKMYLENKLIQKDALNFCGTPIDLSRIRTPSFILSARDDHIAPWKSTYSAMQIFTGPVKFCLATSGHIAGVINPPCAAKYSYWSNPKNSATPEAWLKDATECPGSWWPEWAKWLKTYSGDEICARIPGEGALDVIEDAPGSYVLTKAD